MYFKVRIVHQKIIKIKYKKELYEKKTCNITHTFMIFFFFQRSFEQQLTHGNQNAKRNIKFASFR